MRSRSWLHPVLATVITLSGALAVSVGVAAPASAATSDLRINEVESNGDTADWVELVNPTGSPVDASGLRIKDDTDSRTFAIAAGTVVPAGGLVAIDVDGAGGFGLGAADTARLFQADGSTLIDSYAWTAHAATTYGRCPDATGAFVTTVASTKGTANACPGPAQLRINEVESNLGDPVDWIELVNPTEVPVDASGLRLKDSDDARTFAIAAGTTVPAGGFVAVDVDTGPTGFGLGSGDSARLFTADGATLIDTYSWTSHATTTYGRCPDATGAFVTTVASTKGAANACPSGPAVTVTWNEVESNNDAVGDFAELVNTGAAPFDLSGFRFRDNDDTRAFYTVPAGTVVAPGGFYVLAEGDFGFGLGAADSVRLYAPVGGLAGDTPVDTYAWTVHAATTYGRCPDGTGAFTTTASSTRGAANDCAAPPGPRDLRINEVESNLGDPVDWIELVNPTASPVDASGLRLKDSDDARTFAIAAGTTVPAGGFVAIDVDTGPTGFGLGSADSARLFTADGATLIDSYSWTAHATTTYGRCPDATGSFVTTVASTKAAANSCPAGPAVTVTWNEVESNGDLVGDFAELVNTGAAPFDLSGYRFKDNDDTKAFYTVPAGTVVAPGGFYVLAEADFGFGLGGADSVRLFGPAGGVSGDTAIDTYTWTVHAVTTYGRCPDGTGAFTTTTSSTRGAANDCSAPVRINEVESNDGQPGDWIELVNNGSGPVDVSGFRVKDDDDTRTFAIAPATTIAPGGYLVLEEEALGFGLGSADSARLFAADGTTLLDSYSWTAHAATTYGRCPNGSGAFTTTQTPTKGAANVCPGDLVTSPWPGGQGVTTVDVPGQLGGDISGLTLEGSGTSAPGTLFAVNNGTGTLVRLARQGGTWSSVATNVLTYPGGSGVPDTEGVTLGAAGSSSGVYAATERNNSASGVSRPAILRWDVPAGSGPLTATHEWNLLADLPPVAANAGLEGIAFVPDAYLVAGGLLDDTTGTAYDPARYADHRGGLFLVGLEGNGRVYAYALDHTAGTATRVASFASGFPAVMDLHYEAPTGQLWVVCDDTCGGRSGVFALQAGVFAPVAYYERPTGMPNINNEGFTLAPAAECVGGVKPVLWADDTNTGNNALREGTITCVAPAEPAVQTVTFTSTPPTGAVVGGSYVVTATGGASGNPVTFTSTTPAVCTVAAATVSFAHAGTCTIRADQAGNADFQAGTATQDVVVGKAPQQVTITSTPPASPVVGQTYQVTATGGASGNPVVLTSRTPTLCSVDGTTVTYLLPGACLVQAAQAGDADYLAGVTAQSSTAAKARTTIEVTVGPDSVRATVAVVAPGVAPVEGTVTFLVDGRLAGTAPVTGGVATLATVVPPGATRTVYAAYGGSDRLQLAQATVERRDPSVTAEVTSPASPSAGGWYAAPVTVTFTCAPQGSPLVGDCPAPVVVDSSGADQVVEGSVAAQDGGRGTARVELDVDLDQPTVAVEDIVAGRTYRGAEPEGRCVATDPTSAVDSCVLTRSRSGRLVEVTATATDLAGNTATTSVTYRVPLVQVLGARYVDGRYVVRRGEPFQVQAVLASSPTPQLLEPVRPGDAFFGAGTTMRAAETTDEVTRWVRATKVGNRWAGSRWKVGVLVDGTTVAVGLTVRG